jgi:hypothetical protein
LQQNEKYSFKNKPQILIFWRGFIENWWERTLTCTVATDGPQDKWLILNLLPPHCPGLLRVVAVPYKVPVSAQLRPRSSQNKVSWIWGSWGFGWPLGGSQVCKSLYRMFIIQIPEKQLSMSKFQEYPRMKRNLVQSLLGYSEIPVKMKCVQWVWAELGSSSGEF